MRSAVFAFGGAIDDISSLRRLKYDPPPNRLPLPIAISQPQTVFTIPHYPSPPFYCFPSFRYQSLEPGLHLQRRHSTGSEIAQQ